MMNTHPHASVRKFIEFSSLSKRRARVYVLGPVYHSPRTLGDGIACDYYQVARGQFYKVGHVTYFNSKLLCGDVSVFFSTLEPIIRDS